jgi:acyl-CoA synthetase (AMP-forming)/AMP-acid ligase II
MVWILSTPELRLALSFSEGELVVKSKLLPHGYIDYDDGSFSVDEQGWVTFKTGDRYRIDESKFTWLGRITDYIQVRHLFSLLQAHKS